MLKLWKSTVITEDTLLGGIARVPVDMVILCPALEPRSDAEGVAKLFTITRRADGFFMERHVKLDPVATATEGVLIAGCCECTEDVPDTVAQASAAAEAPIFAELSEEMVKQLKKLGPSPLREGVKV